MIVKPKKNTKKTTKEVVEKKIEEDIPKRYYVQVWKKVEPSQPRFDEIVGTIYWSDVSKEIKIESLHKLRI